MSRIISLQDFLRPELPRIVGSKDFAQEQRELERIDRVLKISGVEASFLRLCSEEFEARAERERAEGREVRDGQRAHERHMAESALAFRCMVLKGLTANTFRGLSKDLARAPLYRWFCHIADMGRDVRVPSKSRLQGFSQWLPAGQMERVHRELSRALADEKVAERMGLEQSLEMAAVWVDTTCLKANIHFPVDWVLMRDGARTLLQSIRVIRGHGLRKRMPEPEELMREMNAVCMGMAAAGRKPGSKKERKKKLRVIKKLSRVIEGHGRRYRAALEERWEETGLTRGQAEEILRRIDNVLEQLPEARRQAHERIIGGRKVDSGEKILSLYERDVHVVVRGKAGAEVEFGNTLFLAETSDGYIVDHCLLKETSPGDTNLLLQRLPKIREACGGELAGVTGDRGFHSRKAVAALKELDLFDGLCPRNRGELSERMKGDEVFVAALKRRAQTEGRIGILKNVFLNETPRSKGFEGRQQQVSWAVLAHNLLRVARMDWKEEEANEPEQIAA